MTIEKTNTEDTGNVPVEEIEYLEVYTHYGASPDGKIREWGFLIYAKIDESGDDLIEVAIREGTIELCKCNECSGYGEQLAELHAIRLLLKFIKKNFEHVPIHFVVDSEAGNLLLNDPQAYYSGLSDCTFLDGILTDIREGGIELGLGL